MSERYSLNQGVWAIVSVAAGLIVLLYAILVDTGTLGILMLPFGIVLLLVGAALAVTGVQTRQLHLVVMMEGKAHRGGSGGMNVIADVRVFAGATPGLQVGGADINQKGICQPYEGVLRKDFADLENTIEDILQSFSAR